MNIYFLLEGRSTEKKIYASWLKPLLPELTKVKLYHQANHNNYCLVRANGYPSILHDYIPDAIKKMEETDKYNYLVICLDAEEETVASKRKEIEEFIVKNDLRLKLGKVKPISIIQNRCIETWLLANRKLFDSRQPLEIPLSDYAQYYDVSVKDPELMGNYSQNYNHAKFHFLYLKEIFKAKKINYSKKNPGKARNESYLDELKKRVVSEPEHLKTFQYFIDFCQMIKKELSFE
ncbi:MAG: hypothetical protein F6K22_20740 [Okeania sp. SIO2F4]|uniref:hypothetical protein n=1 Tax=Okeania sp. SIO2F4 TaxID=2607790 RepID=UPI00142C8A8D|nr:hypothetical protein [Okeania sp. SIO2F4]NES05039.1 hypothetical protein [Okeania sp. SIO2F4]